MGLQNFDHLHRQIWSACSSKQPAIDKTGSFWKLQVTHVVYASNLDSPEFIWIFKNDQTLWQGSFKIWPPIPISNRLSNSSLWKSPCRSCTWNTGAAPSSIQNAFQSASESGNSYRWKSLVPSKKMWRFLHPSHSPHSPHCSCMWMPELTSPEVPSHWQDRFNHQSSNIPSLNLSKTGVYCGILQKIHFGEMMFQTTGFCRFCQHFQTTPSEAKGQRPLDLRVCQGVGSHEAPAQSFRPPGRVRWWDEQHCSTAGPNSVPKNGLNGLAVGGANRSQNLKVQRFCVWQLRSSFLWVLDIDPILAQHAYYTLKKNWVNILEFPVQVG